ncbi:MAG: sugar ABC transporter ATP-binding protein [Spirochaetales bacterium]|jgi:simple sugar transport system ATP-binding protein|nr:sugar ABC transporter ATP-binding protein [Exilispira sp.]NMC67733.1 sugar ABC transporter ATP-binding protein [Spirochaetales bacterium]
MGQKPILEMKEISKEFYGNRVLNSVSFTLNEGQILGLVGENGAGKSTLMNILFGMPVITQTGGYSGDVIIDGQKVSFNSPFDAIAAGIGMVHQEFSLLPGFTATENILLNKEPLKYNFLVELFGSRMQTLDYEKMRHEAIKAINKLGVNIDPDMLVAEMPVGHKQFTEIARELERANARIIVLDEPTAVLTESEAEILLKALKKLAKEGVSIIFISHRLQEVLDIADKIVVLRDGKLVSEIETNKTNMKQVVEWMVGHSVDSKAKDSIKKNISDEIILSVKNLWVDMPGELVRDVSFDVRKGEILGFGGLAGQGKLGIPNGIMGLFPAGGEVFFEGKRLDISDTHKSIKKGLAFVSEDRRGVGLLLEEPIDWNISFTAMQVQEKFLKKLFKGLIKWRNDKEIEDIAKFYIKKFEIKCTSTKQIAQQLSGGNQQKICLAKAFVLDPKILFVSEPTRGIDVGAKKLVLEALKEYNKEHGTTIVIISSELEELRSICDRIAIVDEGKISGILPPTAELEEFGMLMVGSSKQN